MKHAVTLLVMTLLVAACAQDETVAAYGGAAKTWTLTEIDGEAFTAPATLTFPERGQVAGTAPCNSYSAPMNTPYPWFETGPIVVTRAICPQSEAEIQYLYSLSQMTLSEVLGNTLILSTPEGSSMVFKADG